MCLGTVENYSISKFINKGTFAKVITRLIGPHPTPTNMYFSTTARELSFVSAGVHVQTPRNGHGIRHEGNPDEI